jgi:hypothetical protein
MAYGYWHFALVTRDDYTEQWPTKGAATVLVVPNNYEQLSGPEISATPYQIMPGQTIELKMTKAPSGGYGGYSYQWYQWLNNGDQTPIEGATTPNFTYDTSNSMAYGGWNFVLVVTDGLGTQVWPSTGSAWVAVAPENYVLMQTPTVYSNPSSIHPGETASLQTTMPISGGQQPYHYKWYEMQSSGWTLVQDSMTLETYDFTTDSSTSIGNYQFRLEVVDNLGFSVNAFTSVQVLPKGVKPLVAPTIAASATSIHPGDTIHLTITQMPTGGIEPYTYQLYVTTNGGLPTLIDVTPTTLDYATSPTSPSNTLIFALIVKDSQGNSKMSMPVTVQVLTSEKTPLSVPGVHVDKHQVKIFDTIKLSIPEGESVTGGDGKYTYVWIVWSQDNGQMYGIASQSTLTSTLDYTLNGYLSPGNYKFALVAQDGSGQVALGEPSENVIVSPFVAPEAPWGTTIIAIFAAALVFGVVQRRRKTQQ